MSENDYKFEGWCGLDKHAAGGNMVWQELQDVKTWDESCVDIEITHCGICGSDLLQSRKGHQSRRSRRRRRPKPILSAAAEQYLQLLRTRGTSIQVGASEDKLPDLTAFAFIAKGVKLGGSMIGAPWEIEEMLKLAADKRVKPWIQKVPMKDANKAIVDMEAGKARYRYTLVNEGEAML
ncbi:hypothetical protein H2203_006956 [Taxawa tesnikishii (nom. ined.)]|nr:hypothetical protein H2203_006956 [Dothideales sp. JES 119]